MEGFRGWRIRTLISHCGSPAPSSTTSSTNTTPPINSATPPPPRNTSPAHGPWEHFQMSGQGPYFGQLVWFTISHPEKIKSVTDRYINEIKRVTSVIDGHLKKHKTQYLVGDQITYADLMFVPWAVVVVALAKLDLSEYDAYPAWFKRLTDRPTVAKILKQREEAMAANN
ncbi:hypothetical protein E4U09_001309 [Claviceps aff. purpurea]|uniref:GST C-terminal domain-containing protein n=1 Tax=Claviceps aff. purpurea TaxID=1967640 RepID=A0A9P7U6N9_9HYPO|nr:hypothetical protein E4U09_001309 [Claviceps aff. purpurea]